MRTARGLPELIGLSLLLGAGCGPGSTEPPTPPDPRLATALPLPGRHLDRSSPGHAGVLSSLGPDGLPLRHGSAVDPLIIESRRFYDTLQAPGAEPQPVDYPNPFTGEREPMRKTAPLSLDEWKRTFSFPAQEPGETVADYRSRTGIVVYYNKNELGLGRELGCSEFDDGVDASGTLRRGLACFVTNYGSVFADERRALPMAVEGKHARNTVCITYRPSMPRGYEVQFYTFGADGRRQEWAQLDTMGARPQPQVCMNCHGGAYDESRHLAKNSRFLPLDPNLVLFPSGPDAPAGLTRAEQEEPIRAMNALAARTPLTPAQNEMLRELYSNKVSEPGTVSERSWVPAEWKRSPEEIELYDKVVKPYCATCHLAIYNKHQPQELPWYGMFQSLEKLRRFPMPAVVCGTFSMPNAQPTLAHFWDTGAGPVTIGDKVHASPADAFLAIYDGDRSSCIGLDSAANCNRGPDPDALCGSAGSGATCDRDTGRCVSRK